MWWEKKKTNFSAFASESKVSQEDAKVIIFPSISFFSHHHVAFFVCLMDSAPHVPPPPPQKKDNSYQNFCTFHVKITTYAVPLITKMTHLREFFLFVIFKNTTLIVLEPVALHCLQDQEQWNKIMKI